MKKRRMAAVCLSIGMFVQAGMPVYAASVSEKEMFTDRDKEVGYQKSDAVTITLKQDQSTFDGDGVFIEDNCIQILQGGTYVLTGSLTNGQVVVALEDEEKVQLVLDCVSVSCADGAAIWIQSGDKVFLTTTEGSENYLAMTKEASDEESKVDGVIFSKSDLTLNGMGQLTVETACGHGIVTKDDLVITSGTYEITASGHGLQGKDSVRVLDGTVTITSGKDGIHAENKEEEASGFVYLAGGSFQITAEGDGIDAAEYVQIERGDFNIIAGGGASNAVMKTKNDFGGFGDRPHGEYRTDGMPGKNWPQGQMPQGEMPQGEMPQGEMPQGEMPQGEMPQGEMPQGEMPQGEMPQGEMPQGEIPQGEMPQGEMPQGEMWTGQKPEWRSNPDEVLEQEESSVDDTAVSSTSNKGIKAGSSLQINGGNFVLNVADDALHSNGKIQIDEGTIQIQAGDDGIHADETLVITDGMIEIEKSYEGIEAAQIEIAGGNICVTAWDDGINAANSSSLESKQNPMEANQSVFVSIAGGSIVVYADGDGIDSNGNIRITGGEIYVWGPEQGADSALDYDGEASIEGGILVAAGTTGMAQNMSSATNQGSFMINCSGNAQEQIVITDEKGTELLSLEAQKKFSNLVVSSPDIQPGNTYYVKLGDETYEIVMESSIYGTGNGFGGFQRGGR